MRKFKYYIATINETDDQKILEALFSEIEEGWEIIHIRTVATNNSTSMQYREYITKVWLKKEIV